MPEELSIETLQPESDTAVIVLGGELDLANCGRLRETVVSLLARRTARLIIDLTGLSFIDSSGIGVVKGTLSRVKERQGAFSLVCANASILRVLEITGLPHVLPIHATQEEALQSLGKEGPS